MSKPVSVSNLDQLRQLVVSQLNPQLLNAKYRARWNANNPTLGMCSVASEAAWFVLGGLNSDWVAYATQDPAIDGSHWWLQHKNGLIFDPTADQYTRQKLKPPYERGLLGRPCGFMGIRVDPGNPWGFERKPSRRAQQLLDAMAAALALEASPLSISKPKSKKSNA